MRNALANNVMHNHYNALIDEINDVTERFGISLCLGATYYSNSVHKFVLYVTESPAYRWCDEYIQHIHDEDSKMQEENLSPMRRWQEENLYRVIDEVLRVLILHNAHGATVKPVGITDITSAYNHPLCLLVRWKD